MREPAFWWSPTGGVTAALLAPLALGYGAIAGGVCGRSDNA